MSEPKRMRSSSLEELAEAFNEAENLSKLKEPLIHKINEVLKKVEKSYKELKESKQATRGDATKKLKLLTKLRRKFKAKCAKVGKKFHPESQRMDMLKTICLGAQFTYLKFRGHATQLNVAFLQRDTVLFNLTQQMFSVKFILFRAQLAQNKEELEKIQIPSMENENEVNNSLSKIELLEKEWKDMQLISRYKYFCKQVRSMSVIST